MTLTDIHLFMKNLLFIAMLLFTVSAHANPFDYFAGSYSVVGTVAVDNWNFSSCNLWNVPHAKTVSFAVDPSNTANYKLSVDSGIGSQAVESLGDFSCGGDCYYKTGSRSTPTIIKEATNLYAPNGYNSATSRGIIMDQTANGYELFVADVTYDLTSEGHDRNGYCFYTMTLKKN